MNTLRIILAASIPASSLPWRLKSLLSWQSLVKFSTRKTMELKVNYLGPDLIETNITVVQTYKIYQNVIYLILLQFPFHYGLDLAVLESSLLDIPPIFHLAFSTAF